ncbi:MAG: hypothetical protein JXA54_11255 [Candidatus Heimdallarchaeota archaeon]|nr:hypothetical protein [Candidatus Heimdallarchaeota archaeon]
MNYRKVLIATWSPIKAIFITWGSLLMIITFIYFIFFDPKGILNIVEEYPLTFRIINVVVSGLLFFYWLVVWNIMIKAFFKEDLKYLEKNGLKLAESNG